MKAMVLRTPRPVEEAPLSLEDRTRPKPGPGQIRVRVSVCGVCRTDLHLVEGELVPKAYPIIPGHEVVGRVQALGPGCTRFKEGDRVGLAWLHRTCGQCKFCRQGLENLCPEAVFTGFDAPGGFAQETLVDEAFAYPLPPVFSDQEAAPLLCAGIIGYRALRLSGIRPGQTLGLYGFGASAHIAIQVARHWGAEVFIFTRSPGHQDLARTLGAAWVGRAEDDPPARLERAIIFAPAGSLVPQALRVLDKGGLLVLAGIYMSPVPNLDYKKHLYFEKTIRSVTASTRADGQGLLAAAAEIPIRTETTPYGLDQANQALQDLKTGAINGAAVLVL